MITIETKIQDFLPHVVLEDLGNLYGKIYRKYFVDRHIKKIPVNDLKKSYQRTYKISSRHFNSIQTEVDGKVCAIREILKLTIDNKHAQIAETLKSIVSLEKSIKSTQSDIKKILTHKKKLDDWKLNRKSKRPTLLKTLKNKHIQSLSSSIEEKSFKRHQKMRRLGILKNKLQNLEKKKKFPSLCFGSKKLFLKQFHLEESGFHSHYEWQKEWRFQRNSQSFYIGAHCESARNLNAQYDPSKKTLKLRLPKCFEQKYKSTHCIIENLEFHYGHEWLNDAILKPISKEGENRRYTPVSYRFIERKNKNKETEFYCQAIFEPKTPEKTSDARLGSIGLDLNVDHIAMMETDRFGNPVFAQSYPFSIDANSNKIEAVLGDHIATITEHAKKTGKIIVCEDLNFEKKKQALRETSSKAMRSVLSSFAYNKFFTLLNSRCKREGIILKKINPAFTSIIGFYKFSGYEIYTSHECAALAIARRGLGLSERPKTKVTPNQTASIEESLMKVPEYSTRNSDGHVWSFYSRNAKCIRNILLQSSKSGRKRIMFYNPRHPSSYRAGMRCDRTVLCSLSP